MPQWNCSCPNCLSARQGLIPPRTQSCVALAADPGQWFLVNASPDLPSQIESFQELQPQSGSTRNSPITGIFLTNADLDHTLGLFSLREGASLHIYATAATQAVTRDFLGFGAVLSAFCNPVWLEPQFGEFSGLGPPFADSNLLYRAIRLPGKPPPFMPHASLNPSDAHSVAYEFQDRRTGRRLLVAPDVASVNEQLREALDLSDAILFDGTFWSDTELANIRPGSRKAQEMGHLPIGDQSLKLLDELSARKKVYLHINNTNPVLAACSPERAAVEAAGIIVGYDGLEFEL